MTVAKSIKKVKNVICKQKGKGKTIGLVATMGALHRGHLSLIKKARSEVDLLVVSIFVNPLQFAPDEDLRRYPRDFVKDEALLKKAGVNLIFYPSPKTMYPKDFSTYVRETTLSSVLCARSRPGHFRGVTTVVAKLFNIVEPDIAYFGRKDYQQAQIIKQMTRDLDFPVKIKVLPIIREADGLALSSRNIYLKPRERNDALALSHSLRLAARLTQEGERNAAVIKRRMRSLINTKKTCRIEYLEIVDPKNLQPVKRIKGTALAALAVRAGRTRLIDNATITIRK
ncbi:pantoate--beta-alanine ligase [Candidatus Omnitrophota bacterium]